MATTTNIGLTKPAGTDKALVSVLNANSDIIDSAAGGLMDAIAIVANGNTHAAISAGQYVYVHNHGTLAEGLYTANSAIAANATLSTSNLTADASGGLNALNSNTTTNANALTLEAKSLYPVVDGNKCNKNVAYGEYVYVRNSTITNISEGLHWAYKAITANTVIDSSYLVVAREAATINSLISRFTNLFTVKTVSFANSAITANAVFSVSKAVNADTGYSPLCIAGTGLARVSGINFTGVSVSGNNAIVMGYNGSSATSFNGDVYVLCIKD